MTDRKLGGKLNSELMGGQSVVHRVAALLIEMWTVLIRCLLHSIAL